MLLNAFAKPYSSHLNVVWYSVFITDVVTCQLSGGSCSKGDSLAA